MRAYPESLRSAVNRSAIPGSLVPAPDSGPTRPGSRSFIISMMQRSGGTAARFDLLFSIPNLSNRKPVRVLPKNHHTFLAKATKETFNDLRLPQPQEFA